ncbi:MAG: hypothetical protein WC453_01065 [Patescibacteria group bacterium]
MFKKKNANLMNNNSGFQHSAQTVDNAATGAGNGANYFQTE